MLCDYSRFEGTYSETDNEIIGEITSDVEGCIQWDINLFQEIWGEGSYVESPEFTFCDKIYELGMEMLKDIEVLMIHMTSCEIRPKEDHYIELLLRAECNLTSDLHKIVTHNTNCDKLRFFIDFREFLTKGQPLSDRLTITLQLRKLGDNENLADESYSMNRIQEDLKGLLSSGENSDVKLVVGEKEFLVHKNILSARSSVFKKILRFDGVTRDDVALDIKDCDPDTFGDFLTYVYTGSIRHINNKNVISLYTTAVAYGVVELKAACISFMRSNMSVDVFCSIAILALRYDEKELIEQTKRFFCRKAKEIFGTENWLNFLLESPKEVNETYLKALAERS